MRWDLHIHYYPQRFFQLIEQMGGAFSFGQSPTGQTIIRYNGARFFGITPPMTDPRKRLEDMDRVGIDVEVLSLSTPNVYFAPPDRQAEVATLVNDAYAELIAKHPTRFKGFASIRMDDPDAALRELERALDVLKLQGVVVLSNINGRALTDPRYRPFFRECDRRAVCVFIHPMIPANADSFSEYVLGPIIGFPFDTTLAVARLCYDGVFKELPRAHRRAAVGIPATALLRHGVVQRAVARARPGAGRRRSSGDALGLSASARLARAKRVEHRVPCDLGGVEGRDLQPERARDTEQPLSLGRPRRRACLAFG